MQSLCSVVWDVDPVIFSLGPLSVRWYGLAFAIGFTVGYSIVSRMFKHEGAPERWLGSLLAYVVVATVVGARLGHVFFYEWDYYSLHPEKILKIWEGGLASHGGTIAIILALFLWSALVSKKPASWVFDKIVVPIALVGGLIRLGNLMNSEIYGAPTSLPWGFIFVRDSADGLAHHPTQLYEAGCYFILFALLMWMYWRRNAQQRPWLLTGVFFIGIFLPRFLIEYLKNVQVDSEYEMIARYGLNMGQMLSIPFILVGVALVAWALTHKKVEMKFPDEFHPDSDETKKKGKKR